MSLLNFLALSAFFFLPSLSSADCNKEWLEWSTTYTAGAPFSVENKTTPWKITKENIQAVLHGEATTLLPKPYSFHGQMIQTAPIKPSIDGDFERRAIKIEKNLEELVSQTNRNDTLLIIFTGENHAFDFSFKNPSANVTYAHAVLDDQTTIYSDDFYKFWELNGAPLGKKRLDGLVSAIAGLHRLYIHIAMKKGSMPKIDDLTSSRTNTLPKVIVFGDLHGANSTSFAEKFPSKECLSSHGIKTIKFAVEHLSFGSSYTFADLHKIFLPESYYAPNGLDILKSRLPEAYELFVSEKSNTIPTFFAWKKLLENYASKFKIDITGIE